MKKSIIELLTLGSLMLSATTPAFATEPRPEGAEVLRPCAVVDRSSGDTQILNESRTRVSEAVNRAPVYCGGWVSAEKGWVILQHRFGYRIHVGPSTFVQFLDDADAIVLYRGQIFAQAGGGMGELRVLTPNARMRVSRGSVVALFDPEEEKSQLTTVDGKAELENRFDTTKKARALVKSGHASTLDFKLLRVVPSVPKVVATSSLKAKLKELNVPQAQSERALAVARNRQKELFASFENAQIAHGKPEVGSSAVKTRKLASEEAHGSLKSNNDYLVRKTLGGSAEGMKILKPAAGHRKGSQKAKVQVEDPEAQLMANQKSAEDAEKRRLIEELSKIRSD